MRLVNSGADRNLFREGVSTCGSSQSDMGDTGQSSIDWAGGGLVLTQQPGPQAGHLCPMCVLCPGTGTASCILRWAPLVPMIDAARVPTQHTCSNPAHVQKRLYLLSHTQEWPRTLRTALACSEDRTPPRLAEEGNPGSSQRRSLGPPWQAGSSGDSEDKYYLVGLGWGDMECRGSR